MRRVAAVAVLTLSAWLRLAAAADAQSLVTPLGPTAVRLAPPPGVALLVPAILPRGLRSNLVYNPGRARMGGLPQSPPSA